MSDFKKYTVIDIANYIVQNYPNSCLALNGIPDGIDECSLAEHCKDFFYYEKLNWCGCAAPEVSIDTVIKYLKCLIEEDQKPKMKEMFGVEDICENDLLLCLAYTMEAADLTEHGGNISYSWLTNEGIMFINIIDCLSDSKSNSKK